MLQIDMQVMFYTNDFIYYLSIIWIIHMMNFCVIFFFLFTPHRWLCPSGSTVPDIFRAGDVWSPCNCVRLWEPSIVQQVGHQSESVSMRSKRRLHHPGGRGSCWPGNRSHHLHPHLHHHSAQLVSTLHMCKDTLRFSSPQLKSTCIIKVCLWLALICLSAKKEHFKASLNIYQAVIQQHEQ